MPSYVHPSLAKAWWEYLVSSFWLPLPFLTIKGVDRGEEKAELCFLVVLHSLENFLIVLASRLVYLQESHPLGIVVFDCVLVLSNILAVLVSVLFVKKIELYAGLPTDPPSSHPTFGPEVSFMPIRWSVLNNPFFFPGPPHWCCRHCKPQGKPNNWCCGGPWAGNVIWHHS